METIQLGIRFVRGWEPKPEPIPIPGSDVTNGIAQTGDITVPIIVALVLISLATLGIATYALIENKKFVRGKHCVSNNYQGLNFLHYSLSNKVIFIITLIIALFCIIAGSFAMNAYAVGESSPLVPDKSEITATVFEDGALTLDNCNLKNEGTDKYTIEKSIVEIATEAKDIEGLEETSLKITGFEGILYEGKLGDQSEYYPKNLLDLEPGYITNLTFSIDLPEGFNVETLFDKQVFTISLSPKKRLEIKPLYDEEDSLQYFPVFLDATSGQTGQDVHPGIRFYSDAQGVTELDGKTMSSLASYAQSNSLYYSVEDGVSLIAVRSVGSSCYNDVYGATDPSGATYPLIKDVDTSSEWYIQHILKDKGEAVERLWATPYQYPPGPAQINGVSLTNIYKGYNPTFADNGFGGKYGCFWSCVADIGGYALTWLSFDGTGWNGMPRTYDCCICISRSFS